MRNWASISAILALAACAGSGSGGDARDLIAGKAFLNGAGDSIAYGRDGSYAYNDRRVGTYSTIGWDLYLSFPDGSPRTARITNTGSGITLTNYNQDITPLRPVQSTLVGVGRVRTGADCPNSPPEFPVKMYLTATTWSIIAVPGRRFSTGRLDAEGQPMNGSGQRLVRFTGEQHQGFYQRGDCTVDWDLSRAAE